MTDCSNEQENHVREVFSLFDADGNGFVDSSDVGNAMRSIGQSLTETDVRNIKDEIDSKHKGKVDFKLFSDLIKRYNKKPQTKEEILDCFRKQRREGLQSGIDASSDHDRRQAQRTGSERVFEFRRRRQTRQHRLQKVGAENVGFLKIRFCFYCNCSARIDGGPIPSAALTTPRPSVSVCTFRQSKAYAQPSQCKLLNSRKTLRVTVLTLKRKLRTCQLYLNLLMLREFEPRH
ncbi:hypothetical protein MHBO_000204 [Bonamia ostreae]|uniref:Calmodulin n=1 Tax=Bonamia ostreae TaxID=126728 RepID=A0ABV2AEV4_9EUKA